MTFPCCMLLYALLWQLAKARQSWVSIYRSVLCFDRHDIPSNCYTAGKYDKHWRTYVDWPPWRSCKYNCNIGQQKKRVCGMVQMFYKDLNYFEPRRCFAGVLRWWFENELLVCCWKYESLSLIANQQSGRKNQSRLNIFGFAGERFYL